MCVGHSAGRKMRPRRGRGACGRAGQCVCTKGACEAEQGVGERWFLHTEAKQEVNKAWQGGYATLRVGMWNATAEGRLPGRPSSAVALQRRRWFGALPLDKHSATQSSSQPGSQTASQASRLASHQPGGARGGCKSTLLVASCWHGGRHWRVLLCSGFQPPAEAEAGLQRRGLACRGGGWPDCAHGLGRQLSWPEAGLSLA